MKNKGKDKISREDTIEDFECPELSNEFVHEKNIKVTHDHCNEAMPRCLIKIRIGINTSRPITSGKSISIRYKTT